MGLESATYISDLVTTNPTASDPKSAGDDHLRLIKSTLQNTFAQGSYTPTIAGAANYTTGSVAANSFNYTRIDDYVLVMGVCAVTPTATGYCNFTLTLPIASTLGTYDLIGSFVVSAPTSLLQGICLRHSSGTKIDMAFYATATSSQNCFINLMYKVI